MTQRLNELVEQIVRLQSDLDREIEARRKRLGWSLKAGFIEFEQGIAMEHRRLKMGVGRFLARSSLRTILVSPVIYAMIVPLALLDVSMTLYQAICFRAYGIARVRRADYILLDRGGLGYLNWIEALNCLYCGYGNGVISYAREIASRTEQYWCPIKHALRVSDPHQRYQAFVEYGDAEGYRERLGALREQLRKEDRAQP